VKNIGVSDRALGPIVFSRFSTRNATLAWASATPTLCSPDVWPRPPLLRVSEIKLGFSIPLHRPTPNFAPTWNVAPDPLPVAV
jgi:hypothetical protein